MRASTANLRLSWVDHVIDRLQSSPIPVWPAGFLLGGLAYLAFSWIQWSGGAYAFGRFNLFHALFVFELVYLVLLMMVLNQWAETAFEEFRSVLRGSEVEHETLKRKLLRAPAWPTLASSFLSALAFLTFLYLMLGQGFYYGAGAIELVQAADTPLSVGAFVVLSGIRWFIYGGFGYHIYHQLKTISDIYSEWTRINLWNTRPLYAFSRHTARTAIAVIVSPYLWFATGAELSTTGFSLGLSILFGTFALLIFVLPLRGVHSLLEREKDLQLGEVAQQLESLKKRLDDVVRREEFSGVEPIDRAMQSYRGMQARLDHVATWPWQPGLFRNLVGALMIPLVIWILQQILNRYLAF